MVQVSLTFFFICTKNMNRAQVAFKLELEFFEKEGGHIMEHLQFH